MSLEATRRVEHELFMRSFMAFNPPGRVMAQMTAALRDYHFKTDQVIYRAGDPASRLHFIVSGNVELRKPGSDPWYFDENSMIGILDAAVERPYTRTAVALTPTHTLGLAFADFLDILDDNFEYARDTLVYSARGHNELALELAPDGVFLECDTPDVADSSPARIAQLSTFERLLALRSTRFFVRAPVQPIASLADVAEQRHFEPGEPVFQRGQATTELHVVVGGGIRVQRDEPYVSADFYPVRVVGGLAALGYDEHYYDATAITEATTLVISKEDLFDVAEDHFDLARSLFAHVALERERTMQLRQARRATSHPPALDTATPQTT